MHLFCSLSPGFFCNIATFCSLPSCKPVWPLRTGGGYPQNCLNQRLLGTPTCFFAVVAHAPLLPLSSRIGRLWMGCRGCSKLLRTGTLRPQVAHPLSNF